MKNNKKYIIVVTLILILLIVGVYQGLKTNKYTQITQLESTQSRQSMGYIIKTKNGKVILVDGGLAENTDNLISKINENGGKVDYWFLTHEHDDHVGAFTKILKDTDIQINNIYVSLNDYSWYEENEPSRIEFTKTLFDTLENERIKDKVHNPGVNEKINIDNIKAEILGIKNPEITENSGNEQSMVIKFETDKISFLVLGDTGEKSSEKLINTQKEKLKSDIVQMAHHGQAGATKKLYELINPKICFWPTPTWLWNNDSGTGENTGNWKTLETRQWMKELNVEKNYIAKDGNITININ